MIKFIFHIFALLVCITVEANPGPTPVPVANASVPTKALANAGAVRLQFNRLVTTPEHTDSVLIVFDRFDHTGAGIIYQMYAADTQQGIDISNIPAGKYYVTIRFIGLHRDQIEKVVSIKCKKSEKIRIGLDEIEAFSKDHVVIPAYHPDFSDLAVHK